ncbi:MAG: T9SS type A sorting domain-containing protein, partial [Reichenbachiella sp.]
GGGGYIDVSTGTYNETVTFNKDLTFTSDSNPITITNIVMDNDATLTTDANMTISGSVTLTDGIIDAQATFYLGTSATDIVETTGNYITGTITMSSRAVGGTSPFEFLGFNINHVGDLGNVSITRTSGTGAVVTGSTGDESIECTWDVTTDNAPVNNGLITLKWLPAWLNGISDPTIHQDDGSDWVALDDGGGTDGTDGDYTTYVANAFTTTLGSFTIADPSDVLPVELTYLKVTNQLDHILLHWQTASEINHDYFEIQRSKNGEKFEALDRISSHHNSSSTHNYQWKDFNPLAGKSYYRLKMVDFDGYTEYSPIVSASAANQLLALHPNPTSNILNIQSDIEANHVAVFNAIGKQIDLTVENQQIDVSSLLPGVYMLKLISNSEVFQARFVKN